MVAIQAGYTQAMAAQDFMGLAQCCAAAVTQRDRHLTTAERSSADRTRRNYALAPALSFDLESHKASPYNERLNFRDFALRLLESCIG